MSVAAISCMTDVVAAGVGHRYTAAVLRVERGGCAVFERAYGTLDDAPYALATTVTSAFDLASITKVFVAHATLQSVAAEGLALDTSLTAWLPEWQKTAHEAITLRMLLAHTAGLQSGADYRTLLAENIERYALARTLVAVPGERVVYSDFGFIALGALLARVRATSLAAALRGPLKALGCTATRFRPRNDEPASVPATEEDGWRGRVRGSVHDEKAYLMNGVAGHAGLFGTAYDVCRLADAYLAPVSGRRSEALPSALAREAISEQGADALLRRGFGWALKTSDENSCGTAMTSGTFGHTGFTGTSVWADPARDLCVVLLTNAVYYGRRDLRDVRAAVCDAAVREFC